MGFMTASTSTLLLAVVVFISGLANGMWNVPNNSTILGSVPPADLGVIGAFTNLTRTLGNVFGQAIASTVVVGVIENARLQRRAIKRRASAGNRESRANPESASGVD